MKKIMVELWFEDDFVPPKYVEKPCRANNWESECFNCPLHSFEDDYGYLDCHFCGGFESEGDKTLCPLNRYFTKEQPAEQPRDCRGVPGEPSMYEILSMHQGYDDITFSAMELILEKGVDALMYQLNYDDIERVKQFPVVYKRAIELGILKEEE